MRFYGGNNMPCKLFQQFHLKRSPQIERCGGFRGLIFILTMEVSETPAIAANSLRVPSGFLIWFTFALIAISLSKASASLPLSMVVGIWLISETPRVCYRREFGEGGGWYGDSVLNFFHFVEAL